MTIIHPFFIYILKNSHSPQIVIPVSRKCPLDIETDNDDDDDIEDDNYDGGCGGCGGRGSDLLN